MKFFIPNQKMDKIQAARRHCTLARTMPIREFASIVVQLIAVVRATGPATRIMTRRSYDLIGGHVQAFGWNRSVTLTEGVVGELEFLSSELPTINGFPIIGTKSGKTAADILRSEAPVVSDASNQGLCAYGLQGLELWHQQSLTLEQREESSGLRELQSIQTTIEKFGEHIKWGLKGQPNLYWCTDSANLMSYLSQGSSIPAINNIVRDVFFKVRDLGFIIRPRWVSRADPIIGIADAGSRSLTQMTGV